MRQQPDEIGKGNKSLKPISFGEHPGPEPYNASEIVALVIPDFCSATTTSAMGFSSCNLRPTGEWPIHSSGVRSKALKQKRWTIWSA